MGWSDESTLNGVNGGLRGEGLRSIMIAGLGLVEVQEQKKWRGCVVWGLRLRKVDPRHSGQGLISSFGMKLSCSTW